MMLGPGIEGEDAENKTQHLGGQIRTLDEMRWGEVRD